MMHATPSRAVRRSLGLGLLLAPTLASAQTTNLQTMFANFGASASALITLVQTLAMLTGLVIIGIGIARIATLAKESSGGGSHGWAFPLLAILSGVLLLSTPKFMAMTTASLGLGGGISLSLPTNLLGTTMGASNAAGMQAAMNGVVLLIQLLGNIAFFKGLYTIKQVSDGSGHHSMWGALSLIALGDIAINVVSVAGIFGAAVAPGLHIGL